MKSWGLPLWDLLFGRKRPGMVAPGVAPPGAAEAAKARRPAAGGESAAQGHAESTSAGGVAAREATAGRARSASGSKPGGAPGKVRARVPRETAADRYERIAREMLALHGVKVRKWRTSMSGVAWELKYHDGSVKRLIESPRPVGPMSMAIFLHEIGHHAIGFNRYKPRCLEEYHAWKFALDEMEARGLNITAGVRLRVHRSLHYAIGKATRRGLASLPAELGPYVEPPPRKARRRARR